MYSFESRVRYSEVDEDRCLSVTGIMNYLQDCSTFQSEDLGMGVDYLSARHRAWWLSAWQIVMDRRPRLGERITISTWPYDFKGMFGYRNFTIRDQKGNDLVRADSTWFFYDLEQGRPVKVQEADIRGYGTGAEKRLQMEEAPRRIRMPSDYCEAEPVTVARHHIDTNHHVNNAKYVEIAREALPEDIRIGQLRVEYRKAAKLGDVIIPRVSRENGAYIIALCATDGHPWALVWMKPESAK